MAASTTTIAEETQAGVPVVYLFDRRGGGKHLSWNEINSWTPTQGLLWVHLNYREKTAVEWLQKSHIPTDIIEELQSANTRPQSHSAHGNLFIVMRGVNLNSDTVPEEMVSLRIWLEADRIITTRHRHTLSLEDMSQAIENGAAPKSSGEFLAMVAEALVYRMVEVIDEIEDKVDELEDQILQTNNYYLRSKVAKLRRQIIILRRYLSPQREMFARVQLEMLPWFSEHDKADLREVAYQTTHYIEDLDAARDRASILQQELTDRIAESVNSRMYVLTLVAAVFLPLNFVTSLLGINVGGIPGTQNPWSFWIVASVLIFIACIEFFLIRKRKWV